MEKYQGKISLIGWRTRRGTKWNNVAPVIIKLVRLFIYFLLQAENLPSFCMRKRFEIDDILLYDLVVYLVFNKNVSLLNGLKGHPVARHLFFLFFPTV